MSTNMDRWVGKVAVVTGASAGIGASIAEELVKAGVLVVGLARRSERLEALAASLKEAKGKFYPRQCDLRKEEDILSAFEWVNTELGGVDILVNNAGLFTLSKIIDDQTDSFRKILDVNVLAVAIAIRQAVASMKSRGGPGYIVNINSISGHQIPDPRLAISLYASSKYAITALTETVRRELAVEANNKIRITSISPGGVRTEIMQAAGHPDGIKIFEGVTCLEPKDIAEAVLHLLGTRGLVNITELTIRATGELF